MAKFKCPEAPKCGSTTCPHKEPHDLRPKQNNNPNSCASEYCFRIHRMVTCEMVSELKENKRGKPMIYVVYTTDGDLCVSEPYSSLDAAKELILELEERHTSDAYRIVSGELLKVKVEHKVTLL